MKASKKRRVIIDIVMTLSLASAMFIQITGVLLHEIIGIIFFAAIAVHIVFSATWIKKVVKDIGARKASSRRITLAVVTVSDCS